MTANARVPDAMKGMYDMPAQQGVRRSKSKRATEQAGRPGSICQASFQAPRPIGSLVEHVSYHTAAGGGY